MTAEQAAGSTAQPAQQPSAPDGAAANGAAKELTPEQKAKKVSPALDMGLLPSS